MYLDTPLGPTLMPFVYPPPDAFTQGHSGVGPGDLRNTIEGFLEQVAETPLPNEARAVIGAAIYDADQGGPLVLPRSLAIKS